MSGDADAPRRALDALKRVLAGRPKKDDHALADATSDLSAWRNALIEQDEPMGEDRARLERVNAVLSVTAALHFPLGEAEWPALEAAVADLETLLRAAPGHPGAGSSASSGPSQGA